MPLILIGVLLAGLYFGAIVALVFQLQPPLLSSSNVSNKTPTVNVMLYMGEISDNKYGFGTAPNNLSSPGPTLRLYTYDTINITVTNVGKMPHTFAITEAPRTGATVLFNAQVGSNASPLQPDQEGSVVFKPNNAGFSYCYISTVSGDAEAGMWGTVTISTVSG